MTDELQLDYRLLDTDGALEEAAARVDGHTRAGFMKKGALGAGALIAGGGILSALPAVASAKPSAKQNVAILNNPLTLEYLESAFYAEAVQKAGLAGGLKDFATVVSQHEAAHVAFLKKALGGKAVKKPSFDFQGTTQNKDAFVNTAVTLEDTGVKAYSGQAPRLYGAKVVKAAVSILTVEARHAAAFRGFRNTEPAPLAFDRPASMATVLKEVKATHFIKS
jgi:hypothetical protein